MRWYFCLIFHRLTDPFDHFTTSHQTHSFSLSNTAVVVKQAAQQWDKHEMWRAKKKPPHTFICVQRSLLLCWWVWYEPTTILKLTNVNEQFKYENANWHWHSTKLSFKINMQTVINMAFCFDFPILVVRALFWCVNVNYTISLSRCYVCVCVCVCVGHVILTSCLHVIESNSSNTTKTKQKWYYCRSDGINHNVSSGNS